MPWKTIRPMDQKLQLIGDWQTGNFGKTDLSRKYGISRKTADKWISRYQANGIDGLKERSRAPVNRPLSTPDHIIERIVKQKLINRKRGPKKIYHQLSKRYPGIKWPVPSTIGYWLKKKGLVEARKKRLKVPAYEEPFIDCRAPNEVWSADYKGQFFTGDKRVCYPLTVSDNYSRFLIKCQALAGPRYEATRKVFELAFKEYGLPDAIRTDNGTPFAGRGVGGLSRLAIWWIQLGITPERIAKGAPQENGRHERMHRTLKYETLDTKAKNIREMQERFDFFQADYNNYRPHEALDQMMPVDFYKKSPKPYVEKPFKPYYDYCFSVRNVRHSGEIKFKGKLLFISELLTGQPVGLKQISEQIWKIYYSFKPLCLFDLKKNKILKNV